MPKFLLIQPALQAIGGHYYDFAARLLPEIESFGYQPVLAVHQNCARPDWLPSAWQLVPVFRRAESRMRPPRRRWSEGNVPRRWWPTIAAWHDWIGDRLRNRRWQARVEEFQEACRELFERVELTAHDQVLFASAGDLDLAGFGNYLRSRPAPGGVRWSFLFHYCLLEGREVDYARQSARLDMLRSHYRRVFEGLGQLDLHFFTTTERLAAQFNQLDMAPFRSIHYPVNPVFRSSAVAASEERPRRVVCAGGIRREKGAHAITDLIRQPKLHRLLQGDVQLLVQSDDSRKAAKTLALAADRRTERCRTYTEVRQSTAPVVLVPHPLKQDQYADLLRRAHVGLFLYDNRAYYARASGILLEFLTAGLPVIVPAGCWLAEQLSEPTQRYLQEVAAQAAILRTVHGEELHRHDALRQSARTEHGAALNLDLPDQTSDLLFTFRIPQVAAGTWLRIDLSASNDAAPRWSTVVNLDAVGRQLRALAPAAALGTHVTLTLRDAYREQPLVIPGLRIDYLAAAAEYPSGRPTGAVGLTAMGTRQMAERLVELLHHYEHYRRTASWYAQVLAERHSPAQAAQQFLGIPAQGNEPQRHGDRENRECPLCLCASVVNALPTGAMDGGE